eukprot:m.11682 g.11682  ORF g.11682 m.11682 type:complete len:302 (+) comp5762_c0_seq1:262-1167(+)
MDAIEDPDYEALPESASHWVHMSAGAAAGALEHTAMYPVDVLKTRMQQLSSQYTGLLDCYRQTVSGTRGHKVLFRGMGAVILGAGPAHALYFSAYEKAKSMLGADGHNLVPTAAAAFCAAFAHDAFMNPAEVVKQRLQMSRSPYKNISHCVWQIMKREGPSAFYRSFTTQLLMNVPFQCAYLVTYEAVRIRLNPEGKYLPVVHFVSGGLAGGVAAAITTPMDVAKTLLNTQEQCKGAQAGAEATMTSTRYMSSVMYAFQTIYRQEGYHGFLRGMSARVTATVPAAAISWLVYESFKHGLSQ